MYRYDSYTKVVVHDIHVHVHVQLVCIRLLDALTVVKYWTKNISLRQISTEYKTRVLIGYQLLLLHTVPLDNMGPHNNKYIHRHGIFHNTGYMTK